MILIVNDFDGSYGAFWAKLGEKTTTDPKNLFQDPNSVKLVCFTGGADVSPQLYGHQNLGSHNSEARDKREVLIFEQAKRHNIPMFSICRGAQFTSVMCGGTMIQHMSESHGGGLHLCETSEGQEFQVTSSHHQMIVPGPGGKILAWAAKRIRLESCVYDGKLPKIVLEAHDQKMVRVSEVIFYPKERVLCCQSHPEWEEIDNPFPQYILNLSQQLLWGKAMQEG